MKLKFFLLAIITMNILSADIQAQTANTDKKKSLVVYYSRRGNNYLNGEIVDLKTGNTEVVANKIQALTGSDIFRIETVKSYPVDYTETTEVAKKEQNDNARPAIRGKVENMNQYDVIYLGYPNWWGTMPMVLFTFLESYDFKGKTIIPFCTHEGSALGTSIRDIKKLCPDANIKQGLAIRGGNVNSSDKAIEDWLKKTSE
ncbi:flavodoxin [Dysgonomonas hofstadii]|uniref:Flavodoxin n=1 Tax=Dysgonomonas hofstadii TaxID=637886 RepID=A0A840CMN0_9BACT|nr:flavodoxin [Dysgonomonas hofstadii]MBB4034255.1 flavodoxin [Dysgonomonas hofstadii]